MKTPIKIAILASGSGSNAENIYHYFSQNTAVEIDSIYTNKADAYVIERAKKLGVKCYYFPNSTFKQGRAILEKMREREIDFVVLAGFLLKIPSNIIQAFPNRMVNIHPALLPKFGGKGMYGDFVHQAVKDAHETTTGITIHFVNENYDEGATIFQALCEVLSSDSPSDIANKVHQLEYDHFPRVIKEVIEKSLL
jgi:phosphoribosylglycinamide formyltransferase-1